MHYFLRRDIDGSKYLFAPVLELRWSWIYYADELWKQIDPALGPIYDRLLVRHALLTQGLTDVGRSGDADERALV